MNFTFDYPILDEVKQIVVSIDDAVVAEAQKIGIDLARMEAEAKTAIDKLFHKITDPTLWQTIKEDVTSVIDVVEDVVIGADDTDPAPKA